MLPNFWLFLNHPQAEKSYSEYVFYSLMAETKVQFNEVESFLYELAGGCEIVTRDEISQLLRKLEITEPNIDEIVDILLESTFWGLETNKDKFDFIYEENRKPILKKSASRISQNTGIERYLINKPFHAFLGIQPSEF